MKPFTAAAIAALVAAAPAAPPHDYAIRAVPMTAVTIDDGFWAPKLEINRTVTIPHILKENDDTGRVANFEKAARQEERPVRRAPLQRHRHLQDHRGGVVLAGAGARSAAEHEARRADSS